MRIAKHIGIWCITGLTASALIGCANDQRPRDVPSSAIYKVAGDQRLVYTASEPGTVWVTEGANNILYSTPVVPGDRVVLDPDSGKLLLNSQVVLDKDVTHVDHKIFFTAGPAPVRPEPVVASDASKLRTQGVPMTALIGGEGKDRVEYTAPRDGFIWITDEDQQRVLYSGPATRGDVFTIDPQKNLLALNGQPLAKPDLNHNNHRIFFSSERPSWRPAGEQSAAAETLIRPTDVPAGAVKRAEGSDRIDFVATADGTIWVADMTTARTVYTGRVLTNDHFSLDPSANRLTLNGEPVRTPELAHDHYAIFFSER